jgi:hypothetical protein
MMQLTRCEHTDDAAANDYYFRQENFSLTLTRAVDLNREDTKLTLYMTAYIK